MRRVLICLGAALTVLAIQAFGWEKDLHYGLTKWLAYEAGFSLENAETIALGTQAPDEGKLYPAPGAVWHSACIGHDPDISALVQEFHFPGYGKVPGPATGRAVAPGGPKDNAATDLVEKEIQSQLPNQPPEKTLTSLGKSLHPLEDSWSHQGVPDTPPWPCSKDLSWGHPASRNGWLKHDADLTYLHPQDTVETAGRVYEFLVRFLNNHPSMKRDQRRAAPAWSSLLPSVEKFTAASSKADKKAWFQSQPDVPFQSYRDQKFLDKINLPDTTKKRSAQVPDFQNQPASVVFAQQYYPPREIEAFVENFLTQWIVKHDVEGLLGNTDTRQLRDSLVPQSEPALRNTDPALFAQTLYFMWLVRDHGFVNHLGHGLGEVAGSEKQLDFREQLQLLRSEPLIDVGAIRGPEMNYHLSRFPNSDDYAVIIEFSHAPRDACILTVGKPANSGHQFVVKHMDWYTL